MAGFDAGEALGRGDAGTRGVIGRQRTDEPGAGRDEAVAQELVRGEQKSRRHGEETVLVGERKPFQSIRLPFGEARVSEQGTAVGRGSM